MLKPLKLLMCCCLVFCFGNISSCPQPGCDGSCSSPVDVDDCRFCCDSHTLCVQCCRNNYHGANQTSCEYYCNFVTEELFVNIGAPSPLSDE